MFDYPFFFEEVFGGMGAQECTGDTKTCPDPECFACGVRDCPDGEPLHYHHDGYPVCSGAIPQ